MENFGFCPKQVLKKEGARLCKSFKFTDFGLNFTLINLLDLGGKSATMGNLSVCPKLVYHIV